MARKKRGKPKEEEASEAWLLPYSDLLTLLLALFICLFAMSQTDQKKVTEMAQAFSAAFNSGGPSFFNKMGPNEGRMADIPYDEDKGNSAYIQENQKLEQVQKQMEEYIQENNLQEELSTQMTEEGLMIRIGERALFPSGSATLGNQAQQIVPVVAGLLASVNERVLISGHTDNVPINTAQFPTNWDLSSARALNFMKYMLAQNGNLDPHRFSAIGYGEYRPIADNNTPAGRQQNRRVEILIARNYQFNPNEAGEDGGSLASSPTGTLPLTDTAPASLNPNAAKHTPGTAPGEAPVPVLDEAPKPVMTPSDPLQTK
jgi:chemotaxis protein MotB